MKGIADTGLVVAFASPTDQYHAWAREVAGQLCEPLLTCEAVLAESAFMLRSSAVVLALVELGMLQVAFQAEQHWKSLVRLAGRYDDRRPDFADLCLICMSELYPRHRVVTTDVADFRVYRRHGRETIPLLCPH